MNFTNIYCISEKCHGKNIVMDGAGGQSGGRLTMVKVKCPECGLILMIAPMKPEYEYSISVRTEAEAANEIKENQIKAAKLELARKIIAIRGLESDLSDLI